ncbi:MAG TPA: QueT transporter family protein [Acidilobales archaeon]|nr:QueT transporter family protein [Acidilobales archaeon]
MKFRLGVKGMIIAALYVALTVTPPLNAISYGPIQVRISDALLMLAAIEYFGLEAVLGVTIGCAIANIASMYGPPDIVVGSIANLIASLLIYVISRKFKGILARVLSAIAASLIIAVLIGYTILHIIAGIPGPLMLIASVLVGEIIAVVILGTMLSIVIERRLRLRM